jgi:hypothetical protein
MNVEIDDIEEFIKLYRDKTKGTADKNTNNMVNNTYTNNTYTNNNTNEINNSVTCNSINTTNLNTINTERVISTSSSSTTNDDMMIAQIDNQLRDVLNNTLNIYENNCRSICNTIISLKLFTDISDYN